MKLPTRRAAVTTGCITVAAAALAVVAAQGSPLPTTSTSLAAHAAPTRPAPSSLFTSPTLRTPSILPPTLPSALTSSPSVIVIPVPPNPVPARGNAATVAAAANNAPAGGSTNKSTTTKKSSTGSSGGGASAAGSSYPEHADIANAIYSLLNQERAENGLAALGRSSQLNSSAHAHNVAMANTGQFAHTVTGEATLGPRITATGYHWTSAGENIAWGSNASVSFGQSLEAEMYNEKPPGETGHRENILSTSFHNVGVDVITDASGKMWITCDFGS